MGARDVKPKHNDKMFDSYECNTEKIKEMDKKVDERGHFLDRLNLNTKENKRRMNMKNLLKIYDLFVKNKAKDIKKQFSKEDWNTLQDAIELRKMGKDCAL